MDKRGHVLNAVLLSVGLGIVLQVARNPGAAVVPAEFAVTVGAVGPPVVLGALLPDVDTVVGTHRKTLHNLPVLAFFYAFPLLYGNLAYVWIGILAHYVLDLLGSTRGLALLYPCPREFALGPDVPTTGPAAVAVTLAVTAAELAVVSVAVAHGLPILDPAPQVESFRVARSP